MTTIAQVAEAMQTVLTTVADTAARETGFVKRRRKLTGARFVQTLVLGWLNQPQASLETLTQTTAALGVTVRPQALDQRFTPQAAACLAQVLDAAVAEVVSADPVAIAVLQRFSVVILQDSSTVPLPAALAEVWPGCGGTAGHGTAALKVQVRLDLLHGTLAGPVVQSGRTHDRQSPTQTAPLPPGALRVADLGYFSLDVLAQIAAQGAYFLSRLQPQTAVFDADGQRVDLGRWLPAAGIGQVEREVTLGCRQRLPVRLLAVRVPEAVINQRRRRLKAEARRRGQTASKAALALADWTILITNAPADKLSLAQALVVAHARWQVELLFKLWKQHGQLDTWRSNKPYRILCEVYAKLVALVIQHWLLVTGCWQTPQRSLVKAAETVRRHAMLLVSALAGLLELAAAVAQVQQCLAKGCRMNRRRKHPNTYQRLLALSDAA